MGNIKIYTFSLEKRQNLSDYRSDKGLKGTIVNRALPLL